MRPQPPVVRTPEGTFVLLLSPEEAGLLANLADQLDPMLDDPSADPTLRRLFPPAHPDDVLSEAEWQIENGDALRDSKRATLAALRRPAGQHLSEDELIEWVQGLNSVRLVLGERLEVSDDPDVEGRAYRDLMGRADSSDPEVAARARAQLSAWDLYELLGMFLGAAVDALDEALPEVGDDPFPPG